MSQYLYNLLLLLYYYNIYIYWLNILMFHWLFVYYHLYLHILILARIYYIIFLLNSKFKIKEIIINIINKNDISVIFLQFEIFI